jgi:signal transduction protein with GAF and PtsI domain
MRGLKTNTAKQQLVSKTCEDIEYIGKLGLRERMENLDTLDTVSRDLLTCLQAATNSLKHLVKDAIFLHPDYATQT